MQRFPRSLQFGSQANKHGHIQCLYKHAVASKLTGIRDRACGAVQPKRELVSAAPRVASTAAVEDKAQGNGNTAKPSGKDGGQGDLLLKLAAKASRGRSTEGGRTEQGQTGRQVSSRRRTATFNEGNAAGPRGRSQESEGRPRKARSHSSSQFQTRITHAESLGQLLTLLQGQGHQLDKFSLAAAFSKLPKLHAAMSETRGMRCARGEGGEDSWKGSALHVHGVDRALPCACLCLLAESERSVTGFPSLLPLLAAHTGPPPQSTRLVPAICSPGGFVVCSDR